MRGRVSCKLKGWSSLSVFMVLTSFSAAIMRYLVSKYNLPDHWYPSNPECRARVDEYLDWHHTNTRAGAAGYFANQVMF